MALQIIKPYIHVEDANGNPYVGARLYIYLPGTTTLAPVFTDDGLSIAAANPATSDAAGNFPRIYIAAGTYKLRAETSTDVPIWEEDNIDTGLSAGTGALPISRGGTGATTAAAARSNLDVPSNSELSALSTQVAALQNSLSTLSGYPQGRLTLQSATPVMSGDVSAAASVYYTPYLGGLVPIYNGSSIVLTAFTELTLALNSNHTLSTIYDCFIINDAGTIRLVTGPAWNTSTAGSGARGSGGGTTELSRSVGPLTNANSMTARYGATTLSVGANLGTYVGSILIDGTAGQVSCKQAYGQDRKWGVWNAYNRLKILMRAGDTTATWADSGAATWRASNGSTNNKITTFTGLAEESIEVEFSQNIASGGSSRAWSIGIGTNWSSGAPTNFTPIVSVAGNGQQTPIRAYAAVGPMLGANSFTCLESAVVQPLTFYGGADDMIMTSEYAG